jgi:hypothetical protein
LASDSFSARVNVETAEGDAFERLSTGLNEFRRGRAQMVAGGGFMVCRSEHPDEHFLIKPEPDLRFLRVWILIRLSRRPATRSPAEGWERRRTWF